MSRMRKYTHNLAKKLGSPWILNLLRSFTPADTLFDRSYGPYYCQLVEDFIFCDKSEASVTEITDREHLVNALFTHDSIQEFYKRHSSNFLQKKSILLLEEFNLIHKTTGGKYGEIVLQVKKFSLFGNSIFPLESSLTNLDKANLDPVVQKNCQVIWENKLLDANSAILQFNTPDFENNDGQNDRKELGDFSCITSAKSCLLISSEQQHILDSLPEWNLDSRICYMKKKAMEKLKERNHKRLKADIEIATADDCKKSRNQHIISSQVKLKNCLEDENNQVDIIKENHSIVTVSSKDNKEHFLNIKSVCHFSCSPSVIKQNFEKEEGRLRNLFNICDWPNTIIPFNKTYENNSKTVETSLPDNKNISSVCSQNIKKLSEDIKRLSNSECSDDDLEKTIDDSNKKLKNHYAKIKIKETSRIKPYNGSDKTNDKCFLTVYENTDCTSRRSKNSINRIKWTFSSDKVQAMWDKLTQLYLEK